MIVSDLSKPFNPVDISWRVGALTKTKDKCIPLAYIDARDVMQRLDEVCGPEGWQCRYPFFGCCEISVKIGNEWVSKANCAGETNVEAEKGQASDSFKRAAVLWGIGRYLYDIPNSWVPVNNFKQMEKNTIQDLTKRLADWQTKYFKG